MTAPAGTSFAGKQFLATVTSLDGDTSEFGGFDPDAPFTRDPALCPDEPDPRFDALLLSEQAGDIASTNIATCTTILAVTDTLTLASPAASESLPAGFALFALHDGAQWDIYSVSGEQRTNLTNNASDDTEPAISPDGLRIAFTSDRDGNSEIYAMNLDGSDVERLTNHAAQDGHADWSPDGTQLVFSSDRAGAVKQLFTMNASDGSAVTQHTTGGVDALAPAWQKMENVVAFQSGAAGAAQIALLDVSDDSIELLPNSGWSDEQPSWFLTDEGTAYLIVSSRPEATSLYHLYLLTLDGNLLWQLTPNETENRSPACCPGE